MSVLKFRRAFASPESLAFAHTLGPTSLHLLRLAARRAGGLPVAQRNRTTAGAQAWIPPPLARTDSDVDLDFNGQGELGTVAALKGEGDNGVGGCSFFNIEVTPPLLSPVCHQASCLQRDACLYVLPAAYAMPDFNTPNPSASMSEPPSYLSPLDLACPDPDPIFVKTPPLVSPVLVSPVTAPASVFNKTALPLAPAPATCAADRTSLLLASQLAPAQLQPAL